MNKQFEEWFNESDNKIHLMYFCGGRKSIESFEKLPFAWKWGVYLEFFDSVGLVLETCQWLDDKGGLHFLVSLTDGRELADYHPTRQEAQQEAIKKAFSLI